MTPSVEAYKILNLLERQVTIKYREIWRDMRYLHDYEKSDGYTYRLRAEDKNNPLYGKRLSIWQDDLIRAIEGIEKEEIE
jgi:hypothetical protein